MAWPAPIPALGDELRSEIAREGRGELSSRADLELAIDAGEVHLDGLHGDEQRLSDVLIADVLGGKLRDPALACGEPDLVLISAGYDAHRDEEQGGCELGASSFAKMARRNTRAGRADRSAGGRRPRGRVRTRRDRRLSVRAMEALVGEQPTDSVAPDFLTAGAASHTGHHWNCEQHKPSRAVATWPADPFASSRMLSYTCSQFASFPRSG